MGLNECRTLLTATIACCVYLLFSGEHISPSSHYRKVIIIILCILSAARLIISSPCLTWLGARRRSRAFNHDLDSGKHYLSKGQFLEAALAFQRSLVHREDSFGAHFGLAFSLEKSGHMDSALPEYFRAYRCSYKETDDTFAMMAGEYLRALIRSGIEDNFEHALKVSDNALHHLKGAGSTQIDELKLGRAFVLFRVGNDTEAHDQFRELVHTAKEERIREAAFDGIRLTGMFQDSSLQEIRDKLSLQWDSSPEILWEKAPKAGNALRTNQKDEPQRRGKLLRFRRKNLSESGPGD